jgi:hypothetical protein
MSLAQHARYTGARYINHSFYCDNEGVASSLHILSEVNNS